MKKIYVATKTRGFLSDLFSHKFNELEFIYEEKKMYEVNSKKKIIISKLARSTIADYLGLIQRIDVKDNFYDLAFSYNRFLNSKMDYVVYLENPLALVHYSTRRNKTYIGKAKVNKYLNDQHLKAIICLSKACFDTINNFYTIPKGVLVDQIYPLVTSDYYITRDEILNKCNKNEIRCLYISSDFRLKGGEDIVEAFNILSELGIDNVKLDIITRIDSLNKEIINKIQLNTNIKVYDFKFNKKELNNIYKKSCILLNPTRQDSFSLVVLEAIKAGNVILTTDLYALTEMVLDNYNGYLIEPKYRFFNKDNMPNEIVWNNREKTIYSNYIDKHIVDFLVKKISYLNKNRNVLEKMALNSFENAKNGEFNEDFIVDKWSKILS